MNGSPLAERQKTLLLVAFFASLHLLVLAGMVLRTDGRVAQGVVLVSTIPLYLGGVYLLRGFTRPLSWLDVAVLLYAVWSVGSLVLYFQAGNPTRPTAYAYGLYHFALPISCYYAVKSTNASQHQRLVTMLVILNAFALAVGVYMHIVRPDFYGDFLRRALGPLGATEDWQYFARMQSYLGSTSVGYMGAASLVLITLASASLRRLTAPLAILFVAGAALSLQRASLVAVALGFGYLVVAFRQSFWLRVATVVSFAAAFMYGATKLEETANPFRETLEARVTTDLSDGLSAFFTERGYARGLRYVRSYPLGVGLGGTSSAADNAGLVTRGEVADANFMRIAADLGAPGLLLFLSVLAIAAGRAWTGRNPKAWLTFLVIHSGIMLSTNVFDSYYISHQFWVLVAIMDADREQVVVRSPRTVAPPISPSVAARV